MAPAHRFDSREELEEWIVEQLLEPIDCTVPGGMPWTHQIEALMLRLRSAIRAHPAAIPILLAHRHKSLASLRWIESMLTVLTEAGLTGKDRAIAQRGLVSYLLGSLSSQYSRKRPLKCWKSPTPQRNHMPSGEEQIRELVNVWMTATKQQHADTVRSLIADDAVFADHLQEGGGKPLLARDSNTTPP